MRYKTYITILHNFDKVWSNNATGAGDQTTDPNPTKDPNNYLAPLVTNNILNTLVIIAIILVVSYLIILTIPKAVKTIEP